jgi:hypothetical protein
LSKLKLITVGSFGSAVKPGLLGKYLIRATLSGLHPAGKGVAPQPVSVSASTMLELGSNPQLVLASETVTGLYAL